MKQLRGCSLFAKSLDLLDFGVIRPYLFETEDEVKSRIETPHAECNTPPAHMRIYSNLRDKKVFVANATSAIGNLRPTDSHPVYCLSP